MQPARARVPATLLDGVHRLLADVGLLGQAILGEPTLPWEVAQASANAVAARVPLHRSLLRMLEVPVRPRPVGQHSRDTSHHAFGTTAGPRASCPESAEKLTVRGCVVGHRIRGTAGRLWDRLVRCTPSEQAIASARQTGAVRRCPRSASEPSDLPRAGPSTRAGPTPITECARNDRCGPSR